MSSTDERGYLLTRANAERELAAAANNPAIALIHNQLADEYEERASDVSHKQSALREISERPGGNEG